MVIYLYQRIARRSFKQPISSCIVTPTPPPPPPTTSNQHRLPGWNSPSARDVGVCSRSLRACVSPSRVLCASSLLRLSPRRPNPRRTGLVKLNSPVRLHILPSSESLSSSPLQGQCSQRVSLVFSSASSFFFFVVFSEKPIRACSRV